MPVSPVIRNVNPSRLTTPTPSFIEGRPRWLHHKLSGLIRMVHSQADAKTAKMADRHWRKLSADPVASVLGVRRLHRVTCTHPSTLRGLLELR